MQNPMMIEYNGETHTIKEWGKKLNMSYGSIHKRLQVGWSIPDALTKPNHTKLYTVNGKTHTLTEWANISGIPKATIVSRLKTGMDISMAIKLPSKKQYSPSCSTFEGCFNCPYDDCIMQ